jgi:hypothetical protein
MIHRTHIQRAFQGAATPFDILEIFVLLDNFCLGYGFVGSFQEEFAVEELFPATVFLLRIIEHVAVVVEPEEIAEWAGFGFRSPLPHCWTGLVPIHRRITILALHQFHRYGMRPEYTRIQVSKSWLLFIVPLYHNKVN